MTLPIIDTEIHLPAFISRNMAAVYNKPL